MQRRDLPPIPGRYSPTVTWESFRIGRKVGPIEASDPEKKISEKSTFPSESIALMWIQRTIRLPPASRGFHLITGEVTRAVPELRTVRVGWMQVFIQHTSASLTINENADPDVRVDFETVMNHVVPEDLPYVHTIEGPDDMPAHVKASMMGTHVMLPIGDGHLQLGTWQGIYLCEHRDRASGRTLVITINGDPLA